MFAKMLAIALDRASRETPLNRMDPIAFARDLLGVNLWEKQAIVARDFAEGHRRIAVPAGHGVGKTNLGAVLVCWALACLRPPPVIITTAPTFRQVRDQLWMEIRERWNGCQRLRRLGEARQTRLDIGDKHYAYGFSTNNPQRFQGIHAARLLFLVDEANGVPAPIWEAIQSCMTNVEAQWLALGNTIVPTGTFYEACSDPHVRVHRISSREHPNVVTGKTSIPGAVTPLWIEEFERDFASMPDVVKARVDAIFPQSTPRAVIVRAWIDKAKELGRKANTTWPKVLAADIARYGSNLSVLARVHGQLVKELREWSKASIPETARRIAKAYEEEQTDTILIDDDGVGGGVTDLLEEWGYPVEAFHGGRAATDETRFYNAVSEAWWSVREALEGEALILRVNSPQLELQLSSREWRMQADKKIRIEPKDEYEKRTGMSSPDQADALTMAVWKVATEWSKAA